MSVGKIVRKIITTSKAPTPIGPYSQAVVLDRNVYLSGAIGVDPKTQKFIEGGVVSQTRQALVNIKSVLEAAGSSLDKVMKTTVFLTNMDDYNAVNEVYKEFFTTNYPARTLLQVAKLPAGALVEIEVMAVNGEVETV